MDTWHREDRTLYPTLPPKVGGTKPELATYYVPR